MDALNTAETEMGANNPKYRERIEFLSDACENRFSFDEMCEINLLLMSKKSKFSFSSDIIEYYDYLKLKFMALKRYEKGKNNVLRPFSYFRTMIENDD